MEGLVGGHDGLLGAGFRRSGGSPDWSRSALGRPAWTSSRHGLPSRRRGWGLGSRPETPQTSLDQLINTSRAAGEPHLVSWIGVCPGQNESAGVNRSGRTRPGNKNLRRLLGIAAMAAIRKKDSYLGVFFRRTAARRGGKRALVAVMHKLAIAIWHVLHDHAPYREPGADHFTRRDPERAMHRMIKEANSLGLTIRFEPITA
nr:transposase [Streptomyces sp. Wb2n-11]